MNSAYTDRNPDLGALYGRHLDIKSAIICGGVLVPKQADPIEGFPGLKSKVGFFDHLVSPNREKGDSR